ncbi:uncharacterized protein LOC113498860 isoform X1 [Trichoplusia ni]|uniref:Uncharacterized protein LOC113498860 isoform X1 n=1 Tax=Trichoplusia ni TaxID=7111 RepID=A0A7E5W2F8_TRINI|nr:uncharacterized protein LOC113498860 isoform X1 [Trichoplusia ni]
MYPQLLFSSVLINFVIAIEQNSLKHGLNVLNDNNKAMMSESRSNTGMSKPSSYNDWHQHFWKPGKRTHQNVTYIDKAENMIRLPSMNKYYEEKKSKRKSLKKSPRRTIQKIIKKNKNKIKKLYIMKMTSYPTVIPKIAFENEQEDFSPKKEETTTPPNQKKKSRKWNSKLPRYPMPFHQMQTRKSNRDRRGTNGKREVRSKRQTRDNALILKDFDEMQFLKGKKDFNVVNAHFKKYW